jgi:hypothetical protein
MFCILANGMNVRVTFELYDFAYKGIRFENFSPVAVVTRKASVHT